VFGLKKTDAIPHQLIKELLGKMSIAEWIEVYENVIKNNSIIIMKVL